MSHTMVGKHSDMAPAVAAAVAWLHVSLRCLLRAACSTLGELGTADHELPNTAPRARSSKLRVGSEADEFEWEPNLVRKLAANTAREPSDEHVRG